MTRESYRFPARLGGDLCLNFSNTIEFRDSERCLEFLHSYEHVLTWCERNSLVSSAEADRLSAAAGSEEAFAAALALRDAIYNIFTDVIEGERPAPADVACLNDMIAAAPRRIAPSGDEFMWTWGYGDNQVGILAPIALAVGNLLASPELQWVRQCPNCGWLFLDTSRNHSRRWCSMEICGSQVKSRRQYERRKTSSG